MAIKKDLRGQDQPTDKKTVEKSASPKATSTADKNQSASERSEK